MRTFSIDKNNDLFIGPDGNLQFSEKDEAVKKLCQHFAKAVRGEMLHKKDKGIPFWPTTFGRQADVPMFETAFRQRMSEIEEVVEVTHFSATVENGELKYQATIRTIYGGFTLNG
ncbi:hypothetical protein JEP40_13890 [Proteus vulgaris]|uniref:hypothetical protein n=1 Tax=Proteus vulgaris TaxID=585 RepID=UPI0018E46C10|nr:hypothetical protein [Proteus vulgaris]MBI6530200.1 hypothetical protein [Proteus vulgaris]